MAVGAAVEEAGVVSLRSGSGAAAATVFGSGADSLEAPGTTGAAGVLPVAVKSNVSLWLWEAEEDSDASGGAGRKRNHHA